ncbi:MAG: hypothetical protein KG003_12010 [Bacteroidetes bacterium]|nr:hypothetical protein [Bacteroidota bacterium]
MAFKDWGMYPFIGEEFARQGFVSVVFNFSHNGIAERFDKITDFTAFEQNTFTKEFADLQYVVDEVCDGKLTKKIFDTERIALVSHSRGCGIALVHSARDERIKTLTTWSPVSTFERWNEHQKKRWRENGFLPASGNVQKHPLKLGIRLLDDIETHRNEYDIYRAASSLKIPWLIIQGTEDLITSAAETKNLYEHSNKTTTEIIFLEHVGHLYNAMNDGDTTTVKHILELSTTFFHAHL